ncbi:hypothetical protein GCM10018779_29730 [Streptomyces griseocarneus]|nr:hypothetical protein GCM10018779_29730 [Streptomyces griseocarneus]
MAATGPQHHSDVSAHAVGPAHGSEYRPAPLKIINGGAMPTGGLWRITPPGAPPARSAPGHTAVKRRTCARGRPGRLTAETPNPRRRGPRAASHPFPRAPDTPRRSREST